MDLKLRMETLGLEELGARGRRVELAIGMFDGVHVGHAAVVRSAIGSALRTGAESAVLTFDPHPSVVLRPEAPTQVLQTVEARLAALSGLGVGAAVVQPFDRAFASLEAEAFPSWLLEQVPGLAGLHVGQNWRFGRGRRGDGVLLTTLGRAAGIEVTVVPPVHVGGEPASSTRIRMLVAEGAMEEAGRLLGRPYFSLGPVIPGRRLGRTIGFPTLNIRWSPPLRPRLGVYVVAWWTADGIRLPGLANYGVRPTVESGAVEPLLEVHLLGTAQPEVSSGLVRVDWHAFLRAEQRFPSMDALVSQIRMDTANASAWWKRQLAKTL